MVIKIVIKIKPSTIGSSQDETHYTTKSHNIGKIMNNAHKEMVLQNKRLVKHKNCNVVPQVITDHSKQTNKQWMGYYQTANNIIAKRLKYMVI